jgi:hypothetical protein
MTDQKISYEEIAYSNMMSIEAIVSLLTRKGLITQQEILDELKAIRVRDEKEKNKEKKKGNHPEWEKLGFAGLILTALEKGE